MIFHVSTHCSQTDPLKIVSVSYSSTQNLPKVPHYLALKDLIRSSMICSPYLNTSPSLNSSAIPPCSTPHHSTAILASGLFLEPVKHTPSPAPLYCSFPLPGMLFPQQMIHALFFFKWFSLIAFHKIASPGIPVSAFII